MESWHISLLAFLTEFDDSMFKSHFGRPRCRKVKEQICVVHGEQIFGLRPPFVSPSSPSCTPTFLVTVHFCHEYTFGVKFLGHQVSAFIPDGLQHVAEAAPVSVEVDQHQLCWCCAQNMCVSIGHFTTVRLDRGNTGMVMCHFFYSCHPNYKLQCNKGMNS